MSEPEIAQAVVAGDGRGLTALLVPAEGYDDVAAAVGGEPGQHAPVGDRADPASRRVAAFTVENGLLTPSQKVRRSAVMLANAEALRRG